MLNKSLNFAIAMILVNAMAGKLTDTYTDFAHLAGNRLIAVISSTI